MEDGYNQKLLKEKENNLQKIKIEKDKYTELFIEKNDIENELNKLKIEVDHIKTSEVYESSSHTSKLN